VVRERDAVEAALAASVDQLLKSALAVMRIGRMQVKVDP
jgi:hypothetical protein